MRLAEMGLKPLALGAHVLTTHRASVVKRGTITDVRRISRESRAMLLDPEGNRIEPPLRARYGGEPKPLDNWVVCWPERHVGIVIGLTHRQEGWYDPGHRGGGYYSDPGDDYEQPYLAQVESHPLYQVREKLNSAVLLVPPWACYSGPNVVSPWAQAHTGIAFSDYALSVSTAVAVG